MLGFLGLSQAKLIIIGVAVAVALTVIGGLYWQNRVLAGDLKTSQENNGKLVVALETQRVAVKAAQENAEEWKTAHNKLSKRIEELANAQQKAGNEARRLADIFSKHDLAKLARRKPGLIERRINSGTDDALGVLERITSGDLVNSAGARETTRAARAAKPGEANP